MEFGKLIRHYQNKWEHISERQLDIVMDHLHTLNDLTPKIKCNGRGGVDPSLIFGLDTKLFSDPSQLVQDGSHNDEVQTLTVWRGGSSLHPPSCTCQEHHDETHAVDNTCSDEPVLTEALLTSALAALPKESIWRVKGFVRLVSQNCGPSGVFIVNWAFGRLELTPRAAIERNSSMEPEPEVLLTVMGERGEMKRHTTKFAKEIGASVR